LGTTFYTIDMAVAPPMLLSTANIPDVLVSDIYAGVQLQGPYLITTTGLNGSSQLVMVMSEWSLIGVQPDVFRIPFASESGFDVQSVVFLPP